MMRHRIGTLVMLVVVGTVFHGCKPEVSTLTWEEIDVETALQEMWFPTGYIDYVSSEPFQAYLNTQTARQVSRALTMATTAVKLMEAAGAEPPEPVDGGTPDAGLFDVSFESDTEKTSSSTNMFVEIACPGPDAYAVGEDFRNGRLRIDSGNLKDFSFRDFYQGAQLLFTFDECVMPEEVLSSQTPGYLFGGFSGILLDLKKLEAAKGTIKAKYAFIENAQEFSILINVKGEGTYRLDQTMQGSRLTLRVVSANGTINCFFNAYGTLFQGCVLT